MSPATSAATAMATTTSRELSEKTRSAQPLPSSMAAIRLLGRMSVQFASM